MWAEVGACRACSSGLIPVDTCPAPQPVSWQSLRNGGLVRCLWPSPGFMFLPESSPLYTLQQSADTTEIVFSTAVVISSDALSPLVGDPGSCKWHLPSPCFQDPGSVRGGRMPCTALMLLQIGFSLLKIASWAPPQHMFPGSCEMQLTWIQPRAEELLPVQPTQSQVLSTCCIRNKWKSLILQIRAQRLREVKL